MQKLAEKIAAERNFDQFYEERISPHVAKYEALRRSVLKKCLIHGFLVLPLFILAFFLLQKLNPEVWLSDFFHQDYRVILYMVFGVLYIMSIPSVRFIVEVKEKIFPEIFLFFGDDFKYFHEGSDNIDHYKAFNILPKFMEFRGQDLVSGKYQDVQIVLEALELRDISYSQNYSKSKTVFKGMVVLFSMNKKFKGRTSIFYDRGKIGNFMQSKFADGCKGLEQIALEDPEFEKLFEVYGNDQIEARYLITTAFMERLLEVVKLFKGAKVEASFYSDFLFLKIPHNIELFKAISIFKKTDYRAECEMIIKQMSIFFSIIEILKLNQRTGL